jgi:PAS domain S-box-containing protein
MLDAEGVVCALNPRARKVLGLSPAECLGRRWKELVDQPALVQLARDEAETYDQPCTLAGRELLVSALPLWDGQGRTGTLLTFFDRAAVQERWEETDRLRHEMSSLLESSYDGIIVADPQRVLEVNASFGRITGVAPSLLIGQRLEELDVKRHVCLAVVQEVIRLTCHHRRSLTVRRRLKSGHEIFVTGSPVFDRHGQVVRVVLNVRDITELTGLEEQIKKLSVACVEETGRPELPGGIVAESPVMHRLLDLVMRVSQVDSTVLLTGESGVGKDVFARLIHRLSPRASRPFVSVNCGAIPENLLESEFFGYERGAFTSAARTGKPGLFEQAQGGTLFLDEVGELPLNLQVKLLEVIQEQRCRRLGGVKTIDLDIRLVAATNRDLRQMVEEGRFRQDLFYRLYVVPIEIPPLRERPEDILPLALMFLKQFNQKYGVSRTLGHELMGILESYSWPGNVRELQNVIERMVVTADSEVLEARHLPESISRAAGSQRGLLVIPGDLKLRPAREALERQLIAEALARAGNTRQAARLLGVDHSTVVRKARRYGLDLRAPRQDDSARI